MTTEATTKTPEEIKSEAKIAERALINVTSNDEIKEETPTEVEHTKVETVEEKIEEVVKTEEELEAAKEEAKTNAERARIQRRIDKEVAKRKELETKIIELQKALEAKVAEGEVTLTEEDIETRAEAKANMKLAEKKFTEDCNKLQSEAVKIDKDFDKKIKAVADDIGPIPSLMIGVLADLDNGGAVLNYLANDPDEAERIYALTNSPAKMAVELSKLSIKVIPKKETKAVSKVPAPITPVGGGKVNVDEVLSDKADMKEWIRIRNKQIKERMENKRAGYR